MTHDDPLILAAGLLCLERRLSYRRLRSVFSFDQDTLAHVRDELIVKGIAVEIDGIGLALAATMASDAGNSNVIKKRPSIPGASFPVAPTPTGQGYNTAQNQAERRQLTVMFCDMAGSTELSTRLDPEDLRDVILSYQDLCRTAIRSYNGFIARYMGDGILVYFGYPQAHEKDAETATRAGLEILANVASSTASNQDISVRLGVATGPVVVGDLIGEGAAEEAAVVGETPNLAARLQSLAEPGQLIISNLTRRLVGDTFDIHNIGLRSVKGIDKPVQAWSVKGESISGLTAHTTRQSPPLVGRRAELERLENHWQQARVSRGGCVLVKAEAGHGKSRLVNALCETVQSGGNPIISLRASAYHTATPLYPVISFLKRTVNWESAESDNERLTRLTALVQSCSKDHPYAVQLVAQLLELPLEGPRSELAPQALRAKTLEFLRDWLSGARVNTATLVIWEDLHWADSTTIELFILVQQQLGNRKTLCVGTHRPEFSLPSKDNPSISTIGLNRLAEADIELIVRNLAGEHSVPAKMLQHIADKSDGVPLFAEELTQGILDARLQHAFEDAASSTKDICVPETLQDSLMARLDSVPVQKEIAQIGSVFGREFKYAHVSALAHFDKTTLSDALRELVNRGLLHDSDEQKTTGFIFKHALIRDTAYHSLLRKTRRQYHAQAAEVFEREYIITGHRQPEILAYHYSECGERSPDALQCWKESASLALQRGADAEAVTHLNRALSELQSLPCGRDTDQLELEVRTMLAPPLSATFGVKERLFKECIDRSEALCEILGDLPRKALLLRGKFGLEAQMGDIAIAHQHAEALGEVAGKSGIPQLQLGACASVSMTNLFLGNADTALQQADAGISIYHSDSKPLEGWTLTQPGPQCYIWSSHALWLLGYPEQASARIEAAFELLGTDEQSQYTRANMLMCGSWIPIWCGDSKLALSWSQKAEALSRRYGFDYYLHLNACGLSFARYRVNPSAQAADEMAQALEAYTSVGYRPWAAAWYANLAQCYGELEKTTEGHAAIDCGFAMIEKSNEHWLESELYRIRGELFCAEICTHSMPLSHKSTVQKDSWSTIDGMLAEALDTAGKACNLARQQGSRSLELRALCSQLRVILQLKKAAIDLDNVPPEIAESTATTPVLPHAIALAALEQCYNSFNEGLDSEDLLTAASTIARAKSVEWQT